MKTRVQRWGNSLAVRIPKAFALESGLQASSEVELTIHDGQIILTPIERPSYTLAELLEGVSDDNLHGEWDTGPSVGDEAW
jgi:antitoxin MazE